MTSSTTPTLSPVLPHADAAWLADTFTRNRARFGGWRMEGDGAGGDQGGNGTGDQGGQGDQSGQQTGGQSGGDTGQQQGGRTFTQAEVERMISDRIGEATRRHQRELDQARQDAGATETQKLELERDRATERADNAVAKAAPKVAAALAQVAAITAGGRPDRAAAIVRQADLDGVASFDGDEWTVDAGKVDEAIGKVLDEYPEWKADQSGGDAGGQQGGDQGQQQSGGQQQRQESRSGGDLGGGTQTDLTLDQFKGLNMGKRAELKAADPETYRRLADAEIADQAKPRVR